MGLDQLRLRGPNGARDDFLLAATAQTLRKNWRSSSRSRRQYSPPEAERSNFPSLTAAAEANSRRQRRGFVNEIGSNQSPDVTTSSPEAENLEIHFRRPPPPGCIPSTEPPESQGAIACPLHLGVVRPASAFRSSPGDVAGGILDVASLAVDAVLRIDDELEVGTLADPLVDAGRTIPV
jgi:hypothetical protein